MGRYLLVLGGNGSVYGTTGWYLVVLEGGIYQLLMVLGIGLLCVCIMKKVEIWLGVTEPIPDKETHRL